MLSYWFWSAIFLYISCITLPYWCHRIHSWILMTQVWPWHKTGFSELLVRVEWLAFQRYKTNGWNKHKIQHILKMLFHSQFGKGSVRPCSNEQNEKVSRNEKVQGWIRIKESPGPLCMGDWIICNGQPERRKPDLSRKHQTLSSDNSLQQFTSFIFLLCYLYLPTCYKLWFCYMFMQHFLF